MAKLCPQPVSQFYDNIGKPLSGGKVYFYATGTDTLGVVYSDYTGESRAPNPVRLDADGKAEIYLDSEAQYDMVVRSASNSLIYEQNKVQAARGVNYQSTHVSEISSSTGTRASLPPLAKITSITGTSVGQTTLSISGIASSSENAVINIKNIKLATNAYLRGGTIYCETSFNIKDSSGATLFSVPSDGGTSFTSPKFGIEHQTSNGVTPYLYFPYASSLYGGNRKIRYKAKGSGYVYLNGYRFPNTVGTAGQKLQTDGSKVLSWA